MNSLVLGESNELKYLKAMCMANKSPCYRYFILDNLAMWTINVAYKSPPRYDPSQS